MFNLNIFKNNIVFKNINKVSNNYINKRFISTLINNQDYTLKNYNINNRNKITYRADTATTSPLSWRIRDDTRIHLMLSSFNNPLRNGAIRFVRMSSKSIIGNVMRSLVTTGIGIVSLVLPMLGFTIDFILSTVGPIGAFLIGRLIWKLYHYRKLYSMVMVEVQKHRGPIQQITRAPFQLPNIQECEFDKTRVSHSDGSTEKFYKCTFQISDNVASGQPATVEILAYKSPFFLIDTKKSKKRFKKELVITNINLHTAYGKSYSVFELPQEYIVSEVNHSKPPENDQSYYDTKHIKEADIVSEKKYFKTKE